MTSKEAKAEGGDDLLLTEDERRRVLERLHSNLAWVGVRIPEDVTIAGKRVPLRSTVERLIFAKQLTDEERASAEWLMRSLEKRAAGLESELAHDRLTRREAEELLQRTVGILRAIEGLRSLGDKDTWEHQRKAVMAEVDDARRWKKFTEQVYGRDEYH
jgi:Family of unknown function (DUF5788)